MLRKIHHFCFYCYFSMTLFNQHENRVNRACYGLSFFYTIMLNVILLLNDTYLIEFRIYPLVIAILTVVLILYSYFIFKKYFNSRYASIESIYKNESRKKFIFFGVVFWLGSFLLFGIVGYNYTNKRKLILEKQSIQNLSQASLGSLMDEYHLFYHFTTISYMQPRHPSTTAPRFELIC